jgi:hypothetical protein
MTSKKKLREIAEKIRKNCELYARHCAGYDAPYKNPGNGLKGMCALASSALLMAFDYEGIRATLAGGRFCQDEKKRGDAHYWVETGLYIIDITATQFGVKEKVLIASSPDPRYYLMDDDIEVEHFEGWWADQRPTERKIERILDMS